MPINTTNAVESTPLIGDLESAQNPEEKKQKMASAATFWKVGAFYGAAAVAFGAFGAHGLKKHISEPQRLANWATAAHYHLIHSVAVLVARGNPVAASLFTAGITLFSGSIYALVLDPVNFKWMGPVTPLGGLCFIAGWISLALDKNVGGPVL